MRYGFDPWVKMPGVGNGNAFQYSYLENTMDRGAWRATVHGVSKELDVTKHTCRLWGDVVQPITPFRL